LVASYYVPQGDRDSGARRLFDFIRFLRDDGWSVDFISANGLGDKRYVQGLLRLGVAVHDDAPTGKPGSDDFTLSDRFAPLATVAAFDLALLAFWPIAEFYLPLLRRISPSTRVVVDSLDLHFLRDARRILHHTEQSPSLSLLDPDFAEQMVGELNTYAAADA